MPVYHSIQELAVSTRTTQYADIIEALQAMRRINSQTQRPQVFLNVKLLQDGSLPFEEERMV